MNDIMESSGRGHKHCVNIRLPKEGCQDCNGWWDVDLGGLAELTLVTCGDVLFNVISNSRPPKTIKEGV